MRCSSGVLLVLSLCFPMAVSAQRIQLPENLRTLERRVRADSNDPAAHFNVALGYWNEERWDEARRSLETAVQIDPQFAAAWLALSMLPFRQRRRLWEEAAEDRIPNEWVARIEESDRLYRRALLIDPLVDFRIVGAASPGRDAAWISSEVWQRIYDFLFRGFDDFRQGRYGNAYSRFQEYLREADADRFPNRAPGVILYFDGLAAAHTERWEVATHDFAILLDRTEDIESRDEILHVPLRTNEYRYILAVIRQLAGDLPEAERLYQEALGEDVGLYMANVRLAGLYEERRDFPRAIGQRQAAVNANPGDASLLYDLGLTQARAGNWQDAYNSLAEAASENPRDARIEYYRGIVAVQLGVPQAARQHFERFIELAPSRYASQINDARRRLDALR